jgi:manganese/zinc/iron transport system substrate-binding protein
MFKKSEVLFVLILSILLIFTGCAPSDDTVSKNKLNIVATTTMLTDLVNIIGKDYVKVNGLMGPGIDPHLYQASAGDVNLMQNADIVVYNGLHLEGKMGDIFESLSSQESFIICVSDEIARDNLLKAEDETGIYDPHIWFNAKLWMNAANKLTKGLSEADPEHTSFYEANLSEYLKELNELDSYVRKRVQEVPEGQRVLVTAHDAFRYFGTAYGFEVKGLQGISTETEAGTSDVRKLADFITERKIKAIFVESSVPPKTIEALQAAVKATGFKVSIGGELYSDSLGGENSGAETYILTFKANIDTIVDALK